MNERDNAMLNANIHEYYMDVTWSLTGACMYQTFMNVTLSLTGACLAISTYP